MAEILTQEEIDMLLDDGEPIKCQNVSKRIEDIKTDIFSLTTSMINGVVIEK